MTVEIVNFTREQLLELMQQQALLAVKAYAASRPPPEQLLNSASMARRLNMSEANLAKLCRDGCPHALAGDRIKRFEASKVIAWMEARARADQRGLVGGPWATRPAPASALATAAKHPPRRRRTPTEQ